MKQPIGIGKNLHRLARYQQALARGIKNPVVENDLGGRTVLKLGFNNGRVAIAQRIFEFEPSANERCHEAVLLVNLQEIEVERCAKRIAAIFKILQVIAMPHNAQRIDLAKTHPELRLVDQLFHQRAKVKRVGRGWRYLSGMVDDWKTEHFEGLTTSTLYAIMALRQRVFVVEQTCAYLDADGLDAHCHHVQAWLNGILVAYARILPPNLSEAGLSIGRVVTAPEVRGQGLGRQLMQTAMAAAHRLHGHQRIHISAQKYLAEFYTELGFKPNGSEYLEDGIPHLGMDFYP